MHNPPPEVYQSWPAPNFVDPETRGPGLSIANGILIAVVLVVVCMRCYTRIPAVALMSSMIVTDSVYGWNRHIWDLPPESVRGGLLIEFTAALTYIWASMFTKLSVVFFCRRLLSPSHSKWLGTVLEFNTVLLLVGNVAYTLIFCFSCQPLHAYWDFVPPTWEPDYAYSCIDIERLWLSGSILNCAVDAIVWLLPLPIVYQLHLPMRQRIAVMGLFTVGMCVILASALKSMYVSLAFYSTYDTAWVGWPTWICGAVEVALGIVCASAPALRPFFSHFFPHPSNVFAGGNRLSYAEIGRGREPADHFNSPEVTMPLATLSPTHARLDSIDATEEMKPWSYNNSRGSSRSASRNGSRRASLKKLETNFTLSRPSSSCTTPNTITPASPLATRLAPVREASCIISPDFKFNQTAALPPPENDDDDDDQKTVKRLSMVAPDQKDSAIDSPQKVASPPWWQRSRSCSTATKRARSGNTSPNVTRNHSLKGQALPLLKTENDMTAGTPVHDTPTSASSAPMATSQTQKGHTRKASAPWEFENFDFGNEATGTRRPNDTATETTDSDTENDAAAAPPSYGEFVKSHSWIRDDQTRRGSHISHGSHGNAL